MNERSPTSPAWTDADVVRSIECEVHCLRAAALLARAIAERFEAAAAGT